MLIANSFLLLATAYATEEKKDITASPANAKQNIQEIILSNWAEKNICTMLLFDVSWSMFDEKINGETKRLKWDNRKNGKKRTNAISWTIEYSELLLKYYPTAKIWLVLFGDTAKLTQKLSNTPFSIADFPVPETDEWTRLDLWIKKARAEFKESYASGCTIKNIIIISDWEPQWYGITKEDASEKALNQTLSWKIEWINFYSIWYNVETFGRDILRSISAWWFYEAEVTTIKTILENMIINNGSSILSENNKLKINTQNFIITTWWEIDNNEISNNSNGSNILWWKWNRVSASSSLSTIIAWKTNSIQTSDSSSILWWRENQITQWDPKSGEGLWWKSSIIWWYLNKIVLWNYSVIWWWKSNTIEKWSHSTIIWNSGHITNGNYSVAMWKRTTISYRL